MKLKTRILQILGVAAIATMGMTSCDTDACADVECGDYGTCLEGDCVCDAGFEGTDCATLSRAEFLASYTVSESCTSGNYTYNVTVSTSATGMDKVVVQNFGDYGVDLVGTVDGNSVTFASQSGGSTATFSGSGQIAGTILSITYTVTDGTDSDSCIMTCTKQ